MEQCEEPGVNQQIAYENVFQELEIHSPIASRSFPFYNALRSVMSRISVKNRPRDPTVETIETFDIPYVGLVRALGMLPINDVMNGYQLLIESDHYQQIRIRGEEQHLMNNINALQTYLTRNYINNINIPQWNVHDLNDHRTNNDMEGYHDILVFLNNVRLCINN